MTSPRQKPFRGMQLNKAHPLARGLVGAWVMNERTGDKVFDLSGIGNDGTNNGADWVPTGMDFDGSADYINLGAPDSLRIGPALTVSVWVYRHTNDANYEGICCYVQTSPNYGGYGLHSMFDGTIRGTIGDAYTEDVYTTNAISNNAWHHIVLRCDGTIYAIYVDAIKASANQTIVSYTPSLMTNARIGWSVVGTEYFDGIIDNVQIYNRALSSDEIAWLHREPYAMFEQPISPASLYYEAIAAEANPYWYYQMLRRRN